MQSFFNKIGGDFIMGHPGPRPSLLNHPHLNSHHFLASDLLNSFHESADKPLITHVKKNMERLAVAAS